MKKFFALLAVVMDLAEQAKMLAQKAFVLAEKANTRAMTPGPKGDPGKDGVDGVDGRDGVDGKDGRDGVDGKNGSDGRDGKDGRDGVDGKNGSDGRDGKDGLPGRRGPRGKDGVDGKDGRQLFAGAEEPLPFLGVNDDLYFQHNGFVYKKIVGKWVQIADLKGPRGERGPRGFDGVSSSGGGGGFGPGPGLDVETLAKTLCVVIDYDSKKVVFDHEVFVSENRAQMVHDLECAA